MSSGVNGPRSAYTASGLAEPLLRMVAATIESCSRVVPYTSMWRLAMSANSAVVNIPHGATNSFSGRVHGAVAAWSRYA